MNLNKKSHGNKNTRQGVVSTDKARVDEKLNNGIGIWEYRKTPDSRGAPEAKLTRLEGEESKVIPHFKSLRDMVDESTVGTWRMI